MAHGIKGGYSTRRYIRVHGPFDGYHLGTPKTPVLIYNLNLGGGFVNFGDQQPAEATLKLNIALPRGPITVNAETVYRDQSGVAVRFVDMDRDTAALLGSTVDELTARELGID
jgi:hypothetical protein